MTATARKSLIVGVALLLLVLVAARALQGRDDPYRAEFVHASGIKTGDEVRVAGIESGTVTGIELDKGHGDHRVQARQQRDAAQEF